MKVLIDCHPPFALAHGGMQIQVEQTIAALNAIGVSAEPLRWWDDQQRGDILHQFGPASVETIRLAHRQKMKVVMTLLLSETCNRTAFELWQRRMMIGALRRLPSAGQSSVWASAAACDHVIVGLESERRVVQENYRVPSEKISTVPLGVSETFLKTSPSSRDGGYLISVGTIAPVKRSVELARLARKTETPILFAGKPFEADNDYWREFSALVDGSLVRHQPHVSSEAKLLKSYRAARGFVLMSRYENWSFVAHEAAACGLPLLLMDLPWSRERFGDQANYFQKPWTENSSAANLKKFYESAKQLPSPKIKLSSWADVAKQLEAIYTT